MFKFLIKKVKPLSYETIQKIVGNELTVRNGYGYGFISTPEIYNNNYLEIGFGKIRSGFGDWGCGFSHAIDSPLKLVLDKTLKIIKITTSSFHNNQSSMELENKVKTLNLQEGDTFSPKSPRFTELITSLFKYQHLDNPLSFGFVDFHEEKEINRILEYLKDIYEIKNNLIDI